MKKLVFIFLLIITTSSLFSQTDFEKVQMEYEKLLKDPENIYGKNKAAGKYYDIRGFKMYVEVYGQGSLFYLFMETEQTSTVLQNKFLISQKNIK